MDKDFRVVGDGGLGGKAAGLYRIRSLLRSRFVADGYPDIHLDVPPLTVLTTDCYDQFMDHNALYDVALSGQTDRRIAHAFLAAEMPPDLADALRGVVATTRVPLAVRSSSLLEDQLAQPFAGIYQTKMIANSHPEEEARAAQLAAAVKLVYASTWFRAARRYRQVTGHPDSREKMAVMVQEVVGRPYGSRFYPSISGIARSYNFYPFGHARPGEGLVTLALGLGRTVAAGDPCWSFSPAYPRAAPPVGDIDQLMNEAQTSFWAINRAAPQQVAPTEATEYLVRLDLAAAEADGALPYLVSTWDVESDRLRIGTSGSGPRILTFAPILDAEYLPLAAFVRELLATCEECLGTHVELEFAVTLPPEGRPARFGLLQVRPMVVSHELVEVTDADLVGHNTVVASQQALGNGTRSGLRHLVYVRPDTFETRFTRRIAEEIAAVNGVLGKQEVPYILIGPGRWGTADPWLGIPVRWDEISGARALVETSMETINVELSQGSHFFHNLANFRVAYFAVPHHQQTIDWEWLTRQHVVWETRFVCCVELDAPLTVRVDGRTSRGVIIR